MRRQLPLAAILQLNPTVGDLVGNARLIRTATETASAQGATWAVTPELALWGYPPRDLLLRPALVAQAWQIVQQLASELPIPVLVGTAIAKAGRLYNSAVWLAAGQVQQIIHKHRLPTYDVFDERRYFSPSDPAQNPLITWQGHRFGVTICEDIWPGQYDFDPLEHLWTLHQQQPLDWVVNLSASPYHCGKAAERQHLRQNLQARYPWPWLYVNQVGANDQLIFDGHSWAATATGLQQAPAFQASVTCIDWSQLPKMPLPPASETTPDSGVYQALVLGLRDYVHKCGFERVVLGLSGGIDSAVVAVLAVEALGPEAVLAVRLPSPYSSAGSLTDAAALAKTLAIRLETLPIHDLLHTSLASLAAFQPTGITEENLQSRLRSLLLMAIANQEGRLVLSTGNKSELAVGYCTLYGDMSGALAPLGDLYKTQVYALAAAINRPTERIPAVILAKPPSAELRPDQKDSDSLPDYDILDPILSGLIEERQTTAELIAAGMAPAATIERVASLVRRAEFKRQQAPTALRVSPSAFGSGWRMAIAQKSSFGD